MGKTRYETAKKFIEIMEKNYGSLVSFDLFVINFKKMVGADEYRTVKPYMKFMQEVELIKGDGENIILLGNNGQQ